MTNAETWFNNYLRPRKPEGSLGLSAQDGHLDSHTAPVESIRLLATCMKLESPIISLLQEWGRRRAGVESRQGGLLWLAVTGSSL